MCVFGFGIYSGDIGALNINFNFNFNFNIEVEIETKIRIKAHINISRTSKGKFSSYHEKIIEIGGDKQHKGDFHCSPDLSLDLNLHSHSPLHRRQNRRRTKERKKGNLHERASLLRREGA